MPAEEKFAYLGHRYFLSQGRYIRTHPTRMRSRDVWEHHRGPIPDGCHIHHIDHDKTNDDIENLELVRAGAHIAYHSNPEQMNTPEANEKKRAWANSEGGKESKSRAAKIRNGIRIPRTCIHCGTVYSGPLTGVFCSRSCRNATDYRRRKNASRREA